MLKLDDYRNCIFDFDGVIAERHVDGAMVGETLRRVIAEQFQRLRDGDRFWYQHSLNPELVKVVEAQTLAVIIRRNTAIGEEIPDDVFRTPIPRARPIPPRR